VTVFFGEPIRVGLQNEKNADMADEGKRTQFWPISGKEWELTFNAVSDPIFVMDTEMRILRANRSLADTLGAAPDELVGRKCHAAIHGASKPPVYCPYSKFLMNGREHFAESYEERLKGYYQFSVSPIYGKAGRLLGSVHVARNVTERKRTEEALRESDKAYRMLFDGNPHPMLVYDLETLAFLEVNDAAVQRYGYSRDEFLSMTIKDIRPPEDVPALLDIVSKTPEGFSVPEGSWRHTKKDGTVMDVEIASQTLTFQGMRARLVLANDVTGRRRAEARTRNSLKEKELLLKEMNNRVKNNLMLISSLLSLQSRGMEDGESIGAFMTARNRVRSMSLIHEMLYRSGDPGNINLASYIHNLAAQVFRSYKVDASRIMLVVDVPDISLDIDTVIPCGLMVNELVSNSLRHAFPEGMDGSIEIMVIKKDGDRYTLVVSDTGIGLPATLNIHNASTLGMQIVTALSEQINGKIEVLRDKGAEFRITFEEKMPG
jgi:PAS domain S-box-containing protein